MKENKYQLNSHTYNRETTPCNSDIEDNIDEFESFQLLPDRPARDITKREDEQYNSSLCDSEYIHKSADLTARGNKNKHYVKPETFEQLITDYYKTNKLSDEICDCVYKIANRLSYRPNFVNYTFREEMVGDAIERMIVALNNRIYKYNPEKVGKNGKKGNAFLYFTKIAENAFINRIKIESKNREAILNYQEDVYYNLGQKGIDVRTSTSPDYE